MRRATRIPVVIATVAACALSACGERTLPGLGSIGTKPGADKKVCFIADVSGSTYGPRVDGSYRRTIYDAAANVGIEGSGRMCVVFAAGPQVRGGNFHEANVAPTNPRNSRKRRGEVAAKVASATSSLDRSLADPPAHAQGSSLIYAVAQAVRGEGLSSGDEIIFLSDMLEQSRYLNWARDNTFGGGIARVLDELRRAQLLPDLRGITLRAPHANQSGRLDKATGKIILETKLPGRRDRAVGFWRRYAEATEAATYTEQPPRSPLPTPPWVTAPR